MKISGERCLCVSNARNKRSYVAIYDGKETIFEDAIWTNDEVHQYLSEHTDVVIRGDLDYLGFEEDEPNTLLVLKDLDDEGHLCKEPLGAKPVYLKDN